MKRNTTRNEPQPPPDGRNKLSPEYSQAIDRLTRYLALRDHSRLELRTKLGHLYPSDLVEQLMADAEARGWLVPEEEIAERLALSLARRHKSQMYIEGQLRQRGLPVPHLEEDRDGETELESIRHLVERKFGNDSLTSEQKEKAFRFLKYRGFKDQAIKQVLNEER